MKTSVHLLQQIVDIAVCAFHGRKPLATFSLASDSAQARNRETNRYSLISTRSVATPEDPSSMTSGDCFVGHGIHGVGHHVERHGIERPGGQREQDGDLSGNGNGRVFGLLEAFADTAAVFDALARRFVEARAEAGEGLEFPELRIGEFEVAGDGPVRGSLGFAADA